MITKADMIGGILLLIFSPLIIFMIGLVISVLQFIVDKIRERKDNEKDR